MSRSYRKTPIRGCLPSVKFGKTVANRKLRRANKVKLLKEVDDFLPRLLDEAYNQYDVNDCGKGWFGDYKMSDPELYRKIIRK